MIVSQWSVDWTLSGDYVQGRHVLQPLYDSYIIDSRSRHRHVPHLVFSRTGVSWMRHLVCVEVRSPSFHNYLTHVIRKHGFRDLQYMHDRIIPKVVCTVATSRTSLPELISFIKSAAISAFDFIRFCGPVCNAKQSGMARQNVDDRPRRSHKKKNTVAMMWGTTTLC